MKMTDAGEKLWCSCRGKPVGHEISFAKYTDIDQRHGLNDNGRRQAFMTHYNGDLEGRLK